MAVTDSADKTPYGTAMLKAISILEYLSSQQCPQGMSEIARNTGMNKTTVFKLLTTLSMVSFVEKDPKTNHYKLGLGLVKLAHSALNQVDIVGLARPYLELLNRECGETVHLSALNDHQVVYIDKLESQQAIRMYSRTGRTAPLHCTGLGKAMLSDLSEAELDEYLSRATLTRYTEYTLTAPDRLREEVHRIRERGYATDNQEHELEVKCIALPLRFSDDGRYAISISAPSYRMTDANFEHHLKRLQQCRASIIERARHTL